MKQCKTCKQEKPLTEFYTYKRKDRTKSEYPYANCKVCQKAKMYVRTGQAEWRKQHRARETAWLQSLKEKPCADCGKSYPPHVMDFDHLSDKTYNVARMPGRYTRELILKEVAKCDVVCSNCHRERTFQRKAML